PARCPEAPAAGRSASLSRITAYGAALLLPLLLAACAPAVRMPGDAGLLAAQRAREHALSDAGHWSLQGRLGVSDGHEGGSGSFSWSQDGARYEFVLRARVLGLRAAGGPAEIRFGENRLPSLLRQDGWSVEYRSWDETRDPPLPTKVYAARPPYKVRLSIESWQFR